jgi:hypothetical protein
LSTKKTLDYKVVLYALIVKNEGCSHLYGGATRVAWNRSSIVEVSEGEAECRDMPCKMASDHRDIWGGLITGIDQGTESI